MAVIVIRDLPENMELDRQAMAAITGGARSRSAQQLERAPRSGVLNPGRAGAARVALVDWRRRGRK